MAVVLLALVDDVGLCNGDGDGDGAGRGSQYEACCA